jgi:hypothetical protein
MSVHSAGVSTVEVVLAVLVELARRAVQADRDLLARRVAGTVDRLDDHLQRRLVARDAGREAALVADRGAHAAAVDDLLQRVEHLGAPAHRLAEARRAERDDHQLLQVEVVVGVRAAVDDVHHRHRQLVRAHAAEVAVQRQARLLGRRARHGHADGQRRVGAQAGLAVAAVEVDQGLVEERLFARIEAEHRLADLGVDVLDGFEHALAEVTCLVAVAQLDRFTRACRCTRRHRSAPHRAAFQQHVAFDGGVASAVQDLPADDVDDGAHAVPLLIEVLRPGRRRPRPARC